MEVLKAQKAAEVNLGTLNNFESKEKIFSLKPLKIQPAKEATEKAAENRPGGYNDNGMIGSKETLIQYVRSMNRMMQTGQGFSIDRFAKMQAASILLKQPESSFKDKPMSTIDKLADAFKAQKDFQELSKVIPEGTRIKSASQLMNKMNEIRTSGKTNEKLKQMKEIAKTTNEKSRTTGTVSR